MKTGEPGTVMKVKRSNTDQHQISKMKTPRVANQNNNNANRGIG